MEFWGDAFRMPKADQYIVKAVRADGFAWEELHVLGTRVDAFEYVGELDKRRYRLIGIEPHASDGGIFQTHALQVVWEAGK